MESRQVIAYGSSAGIVAVFLVLSFFKSSTQSPTSTPYISSNGKSSGKKKSISKNPVIKTTATSKPVPKPSSKPKPDHSSKVKPAPTSKPKPVPVKSTHPVSVPVKAAKANLISNPKPVEQKISKPRFAPISELFSQKIAKKLSTGGKSCYQLAKLFEPATSAGKRFNAQDIQARLRYGHISMYKFVGNIGKLDVFWLNSFDRTSFPAPSDFLSSLSVTSTVNQRALLHFNRVGSSFLKMASALYFYFNFPAANAFKLSMMVQAEADPSNLIQLGLAKKFPSFGEPDVRIPEYIVSLMGALIHHGSGRDATRFAQWLGLKTFIPACPTDNCPEFKEPNRKRAEGAYQLMVLADVEATIKYDFKQKNLLVQAFTHQSFFNGNYKMTGDQLYAASYELLEFIGDAVLDYVITAVLYQMGVTSPEKIADLHKALTCNYFFASIMVKHQLPLHLRRRLHSDIDAGIYGFIQHCKSATEDIHIPDNVCPLSLGFQIEEPKMLADVFEAMVGAIYLDCGYRLDTVWRVVYGLIKVEFDQYLTDIPTDPITWLHSFDSRFQFSRDYFVHVGNSSTLLSVYHGIYRGATFPGDGDTEKNSRMAAARLAMQFFA